MGDELRDDADQRRAGVYSSARIGAAAALTLVLVVLLVLDGTRAGAGIAPDQVVARLRALPQTWAWATPEGRTELLHSIYERIVVRGPEFVGARLMPVAYSLGLALALPERVQPAHEWVLARPTGVGRAIATYEIPIEGRDEWLAAAGLTA